MNAFCQIRHGNYIVDLGYISIAEAENLATQEAVECKHTMFLWFYNKSNEQWEALSVHHPSGIKPTIIPIKTKGAEK